MLHKNNFVDTSSGETVAGAAGAKANGSKRGHRGAEGWHLAEGRDV